MDDDLVFYRCQCGQITSLVPLTEWRCGEEVHLADVCTDHGQPILEYGEWN